MQLDRHFLQVNLPRDFLVGQSHGQIRQHFQLARALSICGDKTCDLDMQWCQEYERTPPLADWYGVRIATEK